MTTALKRPKEVKFEWPQPKEPYPPSQRSGAFIGPSGVGGCFADNRETEKVATP